MTPVLKFYFGPMSSSKTLRLLALAHDFEEKGIPILVLKPSVDNRDGYGVIKSRAGLSRDCLMVDESVNIFNMVEDLYRRSLRGETITSEGQTTQSLKYVFIDECQFLTEKQVDELSDVVDFLDINVLCFGLRTDFQSKLFPASKRLFELADEIEEIKSVCDCWYRNNVINARLDSNGRIVTDGEQVLVGGDDKYTPMCRKCWKNIIRRKRMNDKLRTAVVHT